MKLAMNGSTNSCKKAAPDKTEDKALVRVKETSPVKMDLVKAAQIVALEPRPASLVAKGKNSGSATSKAWNPAIYPILFLVTC